MINIKNTLNNGIDAVKKGANTAYQATKTGVLKGAKYAKDLPKDTYNFVKTNPKKAGKYAAVAIGVGAAIYSVKTAVLNFINTKKENNSLKEVNEIKTEHIENQGEIIEALKESCEDSQAIIDAQHGALEILHAEHFKKAE